MTASTFANSVKQTVTAVASSGLGTLTLGAAVTDAVNGDNFTLTDMGVADGSTVSYRIAQGNTVAIGQGVTGGSGTTCTRDANEVVKVAGVKSVGPTAFTAGATWELVARAQDLAAIDLSNVPTTATPKVGTLTLGGATLGSAGALAMTGGGILNGNVVINGPSQASSGTPLAVYQGTTQVGTISVTAGSGAVTGVGTFLNREVFPGDTITATTSAGVETQTVIDISSNTSITTTPWAGSASGVSFTTQGYSIFSLTSRGGCSLNGTVGASRTITQTANSVVILPNLYTVQGNAALNATLNSTPQVCGVYGNATLNQTVNPAGDARCWGGAFFSGPGPTNTQNWTVGLNFNSACGLRSYFYVQTGAVGVIATAIGISIPTRFSASGASITTAYGLVYFEYDPTTPVTNHVGLGVYQLVGTNNTYLKLGASNGAVVTGNWGIHDDTGYNWSMTGKMSVGLLSTNGYTVGTLPSAPGVGAQTYVTDAVSPVKGSPLTGGGSTFTTVIYTGSAWVAG